MRRSKLGLPFVIHAGECGNAENIREAVECGARRIGHGIAMKGHPDIIRADKRHRNGRGNVSLSAIFRPKLWNGPEEYPMREFLDQGLLVTVNTDNRTVSNTSGFQGTVHSSRKPTGSVTKKLKAS